MGIRNLKKKIRMECNNCMQNIHLSTLKNKSICIDTSIYLHMYCAGKTLDHLIERMLNLCLLFHRYSITPIFIFDGKAPDTKKKSLLERKELKEYAISNKDALIEKINNCDDPTTLKKLKNELYIMNRQSVVITKQHVDAVKKLFACFNYPCIQAIGEADDLCCYLVKNNIAHGCLSEDSDMFMEGCPNIYNFININTHTLITYNMSSILKNYDMTQTEFRMVCWLSDNYKVSKDTKMLSLDKSFELFKDYKQQNRGNIKNSYSSNCSYLDWLCLSQTVDTEMLQTISELIDEYNIHIIESNKLYDKSLIIEKQKQLQLESKKYNNIVSTNKLTNLLQEYNFIM